MANKQNEGFIVKNLYKFLAVFFVLALAACGSSGGGGDDAVKTATIEMESSLASGEQLPQNGTATITATALDSSGKNVPDGTLIEFSATTGRIELFVGTVSGVATTPYFAPTEGGLVTITAEFSPVDSSEFGDASAALTLTVAASPTSLSLATSLPPGDQLAQGGTTSVTATVIGDDGTLISDGTDVVFTTTGGTITQAAQTVSGKATVPYTAPAVGGPVTITATAGAATNFIDLIIASGSAAFIEIESITPERLGLEGSGVDGIGTFVYNVQDSAGNPVADNTIVYFALNSSTGGGEYLSATSAPTVDGKVSVSLISGTVPGVATVTASTSGGTGTVTTESKLTMGYGKTDQDHISLSFSQLNIEGLLTDGLITELGGIAGDRFSNPVPEGTPMFFASSCGIVDLPAGMTLTGSSGSATANWITANPRFSACTTIMWTEGEEAYEDLNANGLYDNGEPHTGIGEPYIDANQNHQFDAGELYFDHTGDGQYTPVDDIWDGDTFVWISGITRYSGNTAEAGFNPSDLNIGTGETKAYTITVADENGQPLVAGSKVKISTDCPTSTLTGVTDATVPDAVNAGQGITDFSVFLTSTDDVVGDPSFCFLTVEVSDSANGNVTTSLPGTLD